MPPIDLRWVPYGTEASLGLRGAVAAAKADEPLAPVTVIVSSNHVGVSVRRMLASGRMGEVTARGRGLTGITFLTTYRLAELLGAARLAGKARRPVSTPVLAAAVRAVLTEEPGMFAPVKSHPATESALVASYRELRDLPPSALDALAATGPRAADVVRIHRAARTRLTGDWYDEEDLMIAAAATIEQATHRAAELGQVIVHLPQRTSLHAALLLRAVAERTPLVVVAGTTGHDAADADVRGALSRLGLDRRPPSPVPLPVGERRTRIVTTSDADDEVRNAVREVVAAARQGMPLDRIAILHPTPDPYARLLHEHLEAAGIPFNGAAAVPLSARVAGRALTGLLALPDHAWSRNAVLAWMNSAPLVHDLRPLPVVSWERISREAGVVGGRDHWDRRLAALVDDRDRTAAVLESGDGPGWRLEQARREAGHARELRRFVVGLIDDIATAAASPRRWSDHASWARRLLDVLLGPPTRRSRWPDDGVERRAAERVELAIDRLGGLDAIEGPVGLDVVLRTLGVELDADLGRVGRFGDGVLVGAVGMGIGLDLDLVIVLGASEGSLPSPPGDDSLLPDRDRSAAGGLLARRRDKLGRDHRELVAALASAERQVLSFARGDLRKSNERVPSRWLLDIARAITGTRWWAADLARAAVPWVTHIQSFDHGLRSLTTPATAQEHRLRTLLAARAGPRSLDRVRSVADPILHAGTDMVEGRASTLLTRFDGNLTGLAIASPAADGEDTVASATSLERWAKCPFDYFLQSILGVRNLENPEDITAMTAIDRGSLVHEVLEAFVLEVLERPEARRPGPFDRWTNDDRARLVELAFEAFERYEAAGLTGRRIFWDRDRPRILADLDATLTLDELVRRDLGSRHFAAELAFGRPFDAVGAVGLPLPDGRTVRFKGITDRIDRAGDGSLLVADYKTGSDRTFTSLSELDPDQGGTRLQLAVYGEAARAAVGRPDVPVRAEYWFISGKAGFTRRGYDLTPEVSARITETLGLIVEGIELGAFPCHPTDQDTSPFNPCWSCDPDFLGVGDLRRAWSAKSDDPALTPYRALIDPDRRATDVADPEDATGDA